eukprot:m.132579 g.132579  ORF g.132579 m.132579 type:complete len:232 (+) comp13091_c1_seq1:42-737(+)
MESTTATTTVMEDHHSNVDDGTRAKALRKAFNNAIKRTLQSSRWENVEKKFSELLPAASHDAARDLLAQYLSNVDTNVKAEFQSILEENNVVPLLNKLDRACEDQKGNAPKHRCTSADDVPKVVGSLEERRILQSHLLTTINQLRKKNDEFEETLIKDEEELEDMRTKEEQYTTKKTNSDKKTKEKLKQVGEVAASELSAQRQHALELFLAHLPLQNNGSEETSAVVVDEK